MNVRKMAQYFLKLHSTKTSKLILLWQTIARKDTPTKALWNHLKLSFYKLLAPILLPPRFHVASSSVCASESRITRCEFLYSWSFEYSAPLSLDNSNDWNEEGCPILRLPFFPKDHGLSHQWHWSKRLYNSYTPLSNKKNLSTVLPKQWTNRYFRD